MGQTKRRGNQIDRIKLARTEIEADIAAARLETELPAGAEFVSYVVQDSVNRKFLCNLTPDGAALFHPDPARAQRFGRRDKAQRSLLGLGDDLRIALLFETENHLMSVFDH